MKFGYTYSDFEAKRKEYSKLLYEDCLTPKKKFAWFPCRLRNGLHVWLEHYWSIQPVDVSYFGIVKESGKPSTFEHEHEAKEFADRYRNNSDDRRALGLGQI